MPQLNPTPWLVVFFFTWLMFLAIVVVKISNYDLSDDQLLEGPMYFVLGPVLEPWSWPWY